MLPTTPPATPAFSPRPRSSMSSSTSSTSGSGGPPLTTTSNAQASAAEAIAWSSLAPAHLGNLPGSALNTLIASTLPHLTPTQLMHLASLLPGQIKRDFLADLPPEVALNILSFVDDVRTLARASRVSRAWRALVNDEAPWKMMCIRRGFGLQEDDDERVPYHAVEGSAKGKRANSTSHWVEPERCLVSSLKGKERARHPAQSFQTPAPHPVSYRKYFKAAHLTESNWRHSGRLLRSHRSPDAGVVTSLAMDGEWIVVGLAHSRVHVFSATTGVLARTLIGHEAGVWSLWLVSKGGSSTPPMDLRPGVAAMGDSGSVTEHPGGSSWAPMPPNNLRTDGRSSTIAPTPSSPDSSSPSSDDMPFRSVFDGLRANNDSSGLSAEDRDPGACQSDPCNASHGWGQANALVVSGGCDKQIRVWDVRSGYCLYVLRGHRSTVRCIKVFHGRPVAVSGGRDHTLRVWDIREGTLLRTLEGHTDSVRCLDVYGNWVVSGSYDCTVRLWNVDTGECLRVFNGHYHQVYTVAFDGERIASGGLDTTVRIWSASTGACLALLQGHTALVCQLQLSRRTNTVITGSADGRIIIFSIAPAHSRTRPTAPPPDPNAPIATAAESVPDAPVSPPLSPSILPAAANEQDSPNHSAGQDGDAPDASEYRILTRVAAHCSSVTGLQYDDRPGRRWVVSGGNDGRVQLWEFVDESGTWYRGDSGGCGGGSDAAPHRRGQMKLIRDLTEPCEGLWRVAFRDDLAVICCLRSGRTVLEIWSFKPVEEDL